MHRLSDITRCFINQKMNLVLARMRSGIFERFPLSRGNEKGAVLVIALMLLAVLTLLGVAALNTTTTEIRISGNEKVYKQAFYNAEAGIAYAVERGVDFFPVNGVNAAVAIPADLAAAAPDVALVYTDMGGATRRVQIRATGNVPGGGVSTIIAGLIASQKGEQDDGSESILKSK